MTDTAWESLTPRRVDKGPYTLRIVSTLEGVLHNKPRNVKPTLRVHPVPREEPPATVRGRGVCPTVAATRGRDPDVSTGGTATIVKIAGSALKNMGQGFTCKRIVW